MMGWLNSSEETSRHSVRVRPLAGFRSLCWHRGVAQTTMWTYTTVTRPDGSIYGQGTGVLTTVNGDVVHLIGHGSGKANPGGSVRFLTMLHAHGATGQNTDLNNIGLVGEYEVAVDGTATNKNWEWK